MRTAQIGPDLRLGGVRIMMWQESLDFGIVIGITIIAFLPARQREMIGRYVKLLMFLLFTSKRALTKSNFINEEVEISFRPILKTNSTM